MEKIIFIALFPILSLFAQEDTTTTFFLEDLFTDEETAEENDIADLWEHYSSYPVNINSVSKNELLKLPFIDKITARKILNYRNDVGNILTKRELFYIEKIDHSILEKILPMITLSVSKQKSSSTSKEKQFQIILRSRGSYSFPETKGEAEDKFAGNRLKSYQRAKLRYTNKIAFNGLIEKDPGEKSYNDFYSGNLTFNDLLLPNSKIIFGDFLVEFGQGLSLWGPYAFGKGGNIIEGINKKHRGIIPYSSSDENRFFRGIATEKHFDFFSVSAFYSHNNIDANIDVSDSILSRPQTGFHRTETELAHKDRLTETSYGASVDYHPNDIVNLSLLAYENQYNHPLINQNPSLPAGNKFSFFSISASSNLKNLRIGGEFAWADNSFATNANCRITIPEFLSFAFSFRKYERDYFSFHSYGFGESNTTRNETGYYFGIILPTTFGKFGLYFDHYKFPGNTHYTPLPSSGNDLYFTYLVKPIKSFTINFRYKNELKEIAENHLGIKQIVPQRIQKIRIELRSKISSTLSLRNRIELIYLDSFEINRHENGFLTFHDLRFSPLTFITLSCRVILFDTDSYRTRLYEYENDLPGTMNNIPLAEEGIRWYLLANYAFADFVKLSVKYSEIFIPRRDSFGTGYNQTEGNRKSNISLQIDFKI